MERSGAQGKIARRGDPAEKLWMLERLLIRLVRDGVRRSDLVDHAIHEFREKDISVADFARVPRE